MSQTKSKPHPKDIGRTPGTICFEDGDCLRVDHVQMKDGYLWFIDGEDKGWIPYHRVKQVVSHV